MPIWATDPLPAWAAGSVTSTMMNTYVKAPLDELRAGAGSWQSYTPVLTAATTNPTNYTSTGEYCRIGDLVVYRFAFSSSATWTQGTGTYSVSLPVNATSGSSTYVEGVAIIRPAAGTNYQAVPSVSTATTLVISHQTSLTNTGSTGSGAPAAFVASTSPIIRGSITYRAA